MVSGCPYLCSHTASGPHLHFSISIPIPISISKWGGRTTRSEFLVHEDSSAGFSRRGFGTRVPRTADESALENPRKRGTLNGGSARHKFVFIRDHSRFPKHQCQSVSISGFLKKNQRQLAFISGSPFSFLVSGFWFLVAPTSALIRHRVPTYIFRSRSRFRFRFRTGGAG